jgi:galactonate dehydratase
MQSPLNCAANPMCSPTKQDPSGQQAVDIIMPDVQKCGGLMEARKIADFAQIHYVPIAPHSQASPIGAMATAHAMACCPNFMVVEWHWGHPAQRAARWKEFVKEGDIIEKGYITVPDRPGIGVTMNEEALRGRGMRGGATRWFE